MKVSRLITLSIAEKPNRSVHSVTTIVESTSGENTCVSQAAMRRANLLSCCHLANRQSGRCLDAIGQRCRQLGQQLPEECIPLVIIVFLIEFHQFAKLEDLAL